MTENTTCIHEWCLDNKVYYCNNCGIVTMKRPDTYESDKESDKEPDDDEPEKCRHVWECLRDRCHNRGKGKYQAYKCILCNKFQRR